MKAKVVSWKHGESRPHMKTMPKLAYLDQCSQSIPGAVREVAQVRLTKALGMSVSYDISKSFTTMRAIGVCGEIHGINVFASFPDAHDERYHKNIRVIWACNQTKLEIDPLS